MNNTFNKNSMNHLTNHQTKIPVSVGLTGLITSLSIWVFTCSQFIGA